MSIFVSYDSIDISHVNSLSNINKQNSTLKRKKLWIAFEKKSGVTDGSLFGEKLNSDQDYFVQKFLILDS